MKKIPSDLQKVNKTEFLSFFKEQKKEEEICFATHERDATHWLEFLPHESFSPKKIYRW